MLLAWKNCEALFCFVVDIEEPGCIVFCHILIILAHIDGQVSWHIAMHVKDDLSHFFIGTHNSIYIVILEYLDRRPWLI